MALPNASRLEKLPRELLGEIVEQLPAPDILRLKRVNRGFGDLIRRSSRIQHKIDLYETGLEPNWSANFTLVDRVKALKEYHSKWEKIDIDKYQTTPTTAKAEVTSGGVYGVFMEDEIRLSTLPSSLRAIEPKRQKIPFDSKVASFAVHPQADVIVVAVLANFVIKLRLMTMSGTPHPSALKGTIEAKIGPTRHSHDVSGLSITSYRLATMVVDCDVNTIQLNVWNWRTGELLFERLSPYYQVLEFLDDYRLVISMSPPSHRGPLRLLVIDTERVSRMAPTQTLFHGPVTSRRWSCLFDTGGYKPSPQEILTAPFYPEPSQRILALSTEPQKEFSFMRVETLLRFAKERAGKEIRWEEWKLYLIGIILQKAPGTLFHMRSWVSGFRFFSAPIGGDDGTCDLQMYDFSARSLQKWVRRTNDGRQVMHPSGPGHHLPWDATDIYDISFGHDCILVQLKPTDPGSVPDAAPDIWDV